MSLALANLSCGYGRTPVLSGVTLDLHAGEFLCLLGANGSGKTALLKTVAGLLPPLGGAVTLEGRPWAAWSSAERAARLAYVPQAHAPLFPFRVLDVVAMGRTARWPFWSGPGRSDWAAAEAALAGVEMEAFAERLYTELSGGERQMVLVARALAQEARFLVLDEPASSLDFGNQVRILRTLRRLVARGYGVLMATHHPEHALRCASRIALLRQGLLECVANPGEGDADTPLDAARLERIYGVRFILAELHDLSGKPFFQCAPHLDD